MYAPRGGEGEKEGDILHHLRHKVIAIHHALQRRNAGREKGVTPYPLFQLLRRREKREEKERHSNTIAV